ncbi:MAG: lysophospholipid acyltransferase family protein [Gemmatimonadota bacterium]
MIRTVWVALNAIVATLVLGLLVLGAALVRVRGRLYDWAGRTWSRWLLWAAATRVRVEGAENAQRDRPCVLVGNHQSWFDVLSVASSLPRPFHFVAKKELASVPVWGAAWKAAGHISIDRSDRDSAIESLDRAGRQMKQQNAAVVIFPEGTRSPTGELQEFKKGAFMLALRAGVEMVPFGVGGSRAVLPKGQWRVRPGTIIVRFGEPVQTAGLTEDDRDRLMEDVRDHVRNLRDEAEAEVQAMQVTGKGHQTR